MSYFNLITRITLLSSRFFVQVYSIGHDYAIQVR